MLNANQKAAIASMLAIMKTGRDAEFGPFNVDAVNYFTAKLDAVKSGKIGHAGNPHGYFIIGLSPSSKRGADNVARQFRFALAHGYTNKAHLACRGLADAGTETAINAGAFFAYPKQTSKLGDVEMRRVAHGIASEARQGRDVGRKTSALFLALHDADAAQAALEFIRGIGEKIATAASIQHPEWMDTLIETIPNFEPSSDQPEELDNWITGILETIPEIQPDDERIISESVKRVASKKRKNSPPAPKSKISLAKQPPKSKLSLEKQPAQKAA